MSLQPAEVRVIDAEAGQIPVQERKHTLRREVGVVEGNACPPLVPGRSSCLTAQERRPQQQLLLGGVADGRRR
jgi:hypothetical protein